MDKPATIGQVLGHMLAHAGIPCRAYCCNTIVHELAVASLGVVAFLASVAVPRLCGFLGVTQQCMRCRTGPCRRGISAHR